MQRPYSKKQSRELPYERANFVMEIKIKAKKFRFLIIWYFYRIQQLIQGMRVKDNKKM
jgi:hypothetical protein